MKKRNSLVAAFLLTALCLFPACDIIEQCGKLGVKRMAIPSGGFNEFGNTGTSLADLALAKARKYGIRFVGPNGLTVANTENGICFPFAPMVKPPIGRISIISQSGGIAMMIMNYLKDENLGMSKFAIIGNKLARFMKKAGFAAYPGMALGGITDYDYLAELAGLGVNGYHGMLISPGEGTRLRINTIYTNIENLPVQIENEHLWVRDFCAMCKKCIRSCPVEAIFDEPQPRGDGGMQCIDHAACREYFTRNYGCAVCLAVCPFSQVGYQTIKARFKGNPQAPRFVIPVEAIQASVESKVQGGP